MDEIYNSSSSGLTFARVEEVDSSIVGISDAHEEEILMGAESEECEILKFSLGEGKRGRGIRGKAYSM